MFERHISVNNVLHVLRTGATIEDYSAEMPEPSRLILGFQGARPIHVVTSQNPEATQITIITVYVPGAGKWTRNFTRRRS